MAPSLMAKQSQKMAVKPQAPKPVKVNIGQAAAAVFTAATLLAAPAFAEADIKASVCAANPTAKICLKNSAKQ